MPIVHVNADDPEACLSAVQLAIDFQQQFSEDVVVDLVGYRRYGHNEGDEPAYTQPVMYQKIRSHPTVRSLWVDRLVEERVIEHSEADEMASRITDRLTEARHAVSTMRWTSGPPRPGRRWGSAWKSSATGRAGTRP
jgi:2-oxoglutarate dehydrogenase E1 component